MAFQDLIDKTIGSGVKPMEDYVFPVNAGHKSSLKISDKKQKNTNGPKVPSDLEYFRQLYKVKPNNNYGNGEVALFWLFGNKSKELGTTDKKYSPDLDISGNKVEVKAYDTGLTKLGGFSRHKNFVDLVNIIFSVNNLIREDLGTLTAFNFNYEQLKRAAEEFCILRHTLNELPSNEKSILSKINLFKNLESNFKTFDIKAKDAGLSEVCYSKNKKRPGGGVISSNLITYGLEQVLLEKPGGPNGYIALLPRDFTNENEVTFLRVIKEGKVDLSDAKKQTVKNNVNIEYGTIKVRFESLFG